ncbi:MAG: M1 family metallopeptidase [Terriglobia bacterium]
MRFCSLHCGLLLALALATALPAPAQATGEPSAARELVEELHRVALDPEAAYRVKELYLRRDALRVELTHGTLVFFQPVAGMVTGALFVGEGHILVMPPAESERRQLAKFTGSPILAESFSSVYFRFTDATEAEWRAQIQAGRGTPTHVPELIAEWEGVVQAFNPRHSVRILADLVSRNPQPYFYAGITSRRVGLFDALLDDRLEEEVLLGQTRWRNDRPYYDIWCSFARETRSESAKALAGQVASYRIQTTIQHDHSLAGTTEVRFRAGTAGDRVVVFELSRLLQVQEVSDGAGNPLPFFQNETLSPEQLRTWGSDHVVVVVPEPLLTERLQTLRFRYRGRVISDLGNGVLYVGARGIWYPSLDSPWPAPFKMEFRYPRALALVASGTRRGEVEEGDWRWSRWVSELPLSFAGFNLGAYESHQRVHNGIPISVHANQQLEPALARPLASPPSAPTEPLRPPPGIPGRARPRIPELVLPPPSPPPPRPAALIEQVGEEVGQALDFFVARFGPFPYPQLNVSQIPGRLGQGYPGLLYLSTFTFLRGEAQARLGLSERSREHFSGLVPAHETAHQWWGNRVRVGSYRDQWLVEALATYSSLLYLESKPKGAAALQQWLRRYRDDLLAKHPDGQPWEAAGPLALGRRLNSSLSPFAYERLVYPKGAWVLHMLRHLLSDKVFFQLLRDLAADYGDKLLSTAALQAWAESRMPPSADLEETGRLDWFFEQWVNDTGIPRYRLRTRSERRRGGGFRVTGTITQRGVSDLFAMPLPVYARTGNQLRLLGRVVVGSPETSFAFDTPTRPDRVVLDPYQTVLCIIE